MFKQDTSVAQPCADVATSTNPSLFTALTDAETITVPRDNPTPLPDAAPCDASSTAVVTPKITAPATVTQTLLTAARPQRKRSLQHVSTISQRREVIAWMEQQEAAGEKHLPSKAVNYFTDVFRGAMKANLMKASRWYKTRHSFKAASSLLASDSVKRLRNRKAAPGRGRKQAPWVAALYRDLLAEYNRMRRSATKINNSLLKTTATHLLMWNSNPAYSPDNIPKITTRWVQQFMDSNNIINSKQTPKRPPQG